MNTLLPVPIALQAVPRLLDEDLIAICESLSPPVCFFVTQGVQGHVFDSESNAWKWVTVHPMLAGGYIRDYVARQQPKDIDFFVAGLDRVVWDEAFKALAVKHHLMLERTDPFSNARSTTFDLLDGTVVQIIHEWNYEATNEGRMRLFKEFDYTTSQCVIWYDMPDKTKVVEDDCFGGFQSLVHPRFYADLAARRLVYTDPDERVNSNGSLRRAIKFASRGWTITNDELAKVVRRVDPTAPFDSES